MGIILWYLKKNPKDFYEFIITILIIHPLYLTIILPCTFYMVPLTSPNTKVAFQNSWLLKRDLSVVHVILDTNFLYFTYIFSLHDNASIHCWP